MVQEKLSRGLRTPARRHSNSTPIAKNAPKPDRARLAGRTLCFNCRDVGHFSRNCPKKRVQAPGNDASVRAVSCDLKLPAIADVLSARESLLEKLTGERGTMETSLVGTERGRRRRPFVRTGSQSVPPPRLCGTGHGLCEDTDWTELSETSCRMSVEKSHVGFRTCVPSSSGVLTSALGTRREQWNWHGTWERR